VIASCNDVSLLKTCGLNPDNFEHPIIMKHPVGVAMTQEQIDRAGSLIAECVVRTIHRWQALPLSKHDQDEEYAYTYACTYIHTHTYLYRYIHTHNPLDALNLAFHGTHGFFN
jgi:hypothetical protein